MTPTANPNDPTRGQIAREVIFYTLLVLGVGTIFVGWRVWREGTRVLSHAPHAMPKHPPRDSSPPR